MIYHSGLDFVASQGEVVLIDEADYFILSDPWQFQNAIKDSKCICFSATINQSRVVSLETEVL